MEKLEVDAIVFDVGNTLVIDPFENVLNGMDPTIDSLISGYGLNVTTKDLKAAWSEANKKINYPYISHFLQEEPIIQHALRTLSIEGAKAAYISPRLLSEYRQICKEHIETSHHTHEMQEVFQELYRKNYRLGVFSNDREFAMNFMLDAVQVDNYLQTKISSEEVKAEKPEPAAYEEIINALNLNPEKIAYVGDDPQKDIIPAQQLGFKTVLYEMKKDYNMPWRDYDIECNPDARIDKISQIKKLI